MSNSDTPDPEPALQRVEVGLQIDIEGHLNPSIFLPSWFGREGLLREGEVREATESLDEDEGYVFFQTQDLALEATSERLRLYSVHQGLQLAYRDLVLNVFTLLRHTPLARLRIIRFVHLAAILSAKRPVTANMVPSAEWVRLVDPGLWSELIDQPTFGSLNVEGAGPGDSRTSITIEPSRLEDAVIFVASTYAYDLAPAPDDADQTSGDVLITTLKEEWEGVNEHSERVFDYVGRILFPGESGEPRKGH